MVKCSNKCLWIDEIWLLKSQLSVFWIMKVSIVSGEKILWKWRIYTLPVYMYYLYAHITLCIYVSLCHSILTFLVVNIFTKMRLFVASCNPLQILSLISPPFLQIIYVLGILISSSSSYPWVVEYATQDTGVSDSAGNGISVLLAPREHCPRATPRGSPYKEIQEI